MEYYDVRRYLGNLSIDVKTPTLKPQQVLQPSPSPVIEEISLKFRVQFKCRRIHATQNNTIISSERYKFRELPFAIDRLPIDIIEEEEERGGDDNNRALRQYLSLKFENYRDLYIIDLKSVADAIKDKWIENREKGNLNVFEKVFPLTVTLKLRYIAIYVEQLEDGLIITSCSNCIETMLEEVDSEEIEADQSCVICLEEIEKKSSIVKKMACLHVFHENCIKKWLENKPSCPICRFEMSTK